MADAIKVTPALLAAIEKSVHHQVAWGAIRSAGKNGSVALALVARIRELEATLAETQAPSAKWAQGSTAGLTADEAADLGRWGELVELCTLRGGDLNGAEANQRNKIADWLAANKDAAERVAWLAESAHRDRATAKAAIEKLASAEVDAMAAAQKLAAATAPTTDAEWAAVLVWAYREVEAGRSAALEHSRPQIDAMLAARRVT